MTTDEKEIEMEKNAECEGTSAHKPGECKACDDAFKDLAASLAEEEESWT